MRTALLLALFLALWSSTPLTRPRPPIQAAEVREELAAFGAEWDAARVAHDSAVFDRHLAPDFYVQLGATRMTRDEFIEEISAEKPNARLVRFDSELLTLTREQTAWTAIVLEKLEFETAGKDGTREKSYSLWVTKDRFLEDGERWLTLSSEALGWETWTRGQVPPFEDWSR